MKNPWFKEEHEIFRNTVRRWAENELAPHADEWEEKKDFPNWVFKRAGELGFLGITYPEDVGGSGCDYFYKVVYCEELPRCNCGGVTMALLVQSDMASPPIHYLGTKEQKERYLTPIIKGEMIAAPGRHGAQCRIRRGGHEDHRPQERRLLCHKRDQDLHHQRG